MSTIEIYDNDLQWWKDCKRKLKMNSKESFAKFKRNAELKLLQDFYSTLAQPSNFCKPLLNIKLDKKYRKNSSI